MEGSLKVKLANLEKKLKEALLKQKVVTAAPVVKSTEHHKKPVDVGKYVPKKFHSQNDRVRERFAASFSKRAEEFNISKRLPKMKSIVKAPSKSLGANKKWVAPPSQSSLSENKHSIGGQTVVLSSLSTSTLNLSIAPKPNYTNRNDSNGHQTNTSVSKNGVVNGKQRKNTSWRKEDEDFTIIPQPKEIKYCLFFNRFGRCRMGAKCVFVHDASKVAVCKAFLMGTCKDSGCLLSHELDRAKMPDCEYFLKDGLCFKDDCPYRHVKTSESSGVCADFQRGYCPRGLDCPQKHVYKNDTKPAAVIVTTGTNDGTGTATSRQKRKGSTATPISNTGVNSVVSDNTNDTASVPIDTTIGNKRARADEVRTEYSKCSGKAALLKKSRISESVGVNDAADLSLHCNSDDVSTTTTTAAELVLRGIPNEDLNISTSTRTNGSSSQTAVTEDGEVPAAGDDGYIELDHDRRRRDAAGSGNRQAENKNGNEIIEENDRQLDEKDDEQEQEEEDEHEGGSWVEEDFISLEKYSRAHGRFEQRMAIASQVEEEDEEEEERRGEGDDQGGAGVLEEEDEPFDLSLCPDEQHRAAAQAFRDAGLLWLIPRCLLAQVNPFGESNNDNGNDSGDKS